MLPILGIFHQPTILPTWEFIDIFILNFNVFFIQIISDDNYNYVLIIGEELKFNATKSEKNYLHIFKFQKNQSNYFIYSMRNTTQC